MPFWQTCLTFVIGLASKWLGIGGDKDPAAEAHKAGVEMGVQKTENANAQSALDEVRAAADARADTARQLDADPDSLRKPGADFAARGSDGIS